MKSELMNFVLLILILYNIQCIMGVKLPQNTKNKTSYNQLVQCRICMDMFSYDFNYDKFFDDKNILGEMRTFFSNKEINIDKYFNKENEELICKEISMQYFFKGGEIQTSNKDDKCKGIKVGKDLECDKLKASNCEVVLSYRNNVCGGYLDKNDYGVKSNVSDNSNSNIVSSIKDNNKSSNNDVVKNEVSNKINSSNNSNLIDGSLIEQFSKNLELKKPNSSNSNNSNTSINNNNNDSILKQIQELMNKSNKNNNSNLNNNNVNTNSIINNNNNNNNNTGINNNNSNSVNSNNNNNNEIMNLKNEALNKNNNIINNNNSIPNMIQNNNLNNNSNNSQEQILLKNYLNTMNNNNNNSNNFLNTQNQNTNNNNNHHNSNNNILPQFKQLESLGKSLATQQTKMNFPLQNLNSINKGINTLKNLRENSNNNTNNNNNVKLGQPNKFMTSSLLELTPNYIEKNYVPDIHHSAKTDLAVQRQWTPKPILMDGFEANLGNQLKDISTLTTEIARYESKLKVLKQELANKLEVAQSSYNVVQRALTQISSFINKPNEAPPNNLVNTDKINSDDWDEKC